MKTTRVIWLMLFFINISCGQDKLTAINIDKISVLGINYETKLSEVLEVLGEPLSHKRYEDIDGSITDIPDIYDYLNYDGIEIQFVKYGYSYITSIESIEIKSCKHPVLIGKKTLRVGEDYEEIKSILPYEFNKFLESHYELKPDKNYQIIGGNLNRGKLEPSNMVFDFENGKIIKISIGFPL